MIGAMRKESAPPTFLKEASSYVPPDKIMDAPSKNKGSLKGAFFQPIGGLLKEEG